MTQLIVLVPGQGPIQVPVLRQVGVSLYISTAVLSYKQELGLWELYSRLALESWELTGQPSLSSKEVNTQLVFE